MRRIALFLGLLISGSAAFADSLTYSDQASFFGDVGTRITDDYTNPGYQFVQTDSAMSAVLNETSYVTLTNPEHSIVGLANGIVSYCGGCNGSFLLDFTDTSLSNGNGVFGVGFEVTFNGYGGATNVPTYALITFADASTLFELMPDKFGYFGITDSRGIESILFVQPDGSISGGGDIGFAETNLTIASQPTITPIATPEPSSILLLASGMLGCLTIVRRKRT